MNKKEAAGRRIRCGSVGEISTWYGTIMAPFAGVSSSLCKSIISLMLYVSGVMDAWKIEVSEALQADLALVCKKEWMDDSTTQGGSVFSPIISVGTKMASVRLFMDWYFMDQSVQFPAVKSFR